MKKQTQKNGKVIEIKNKKSRLPYLIGLAVIIIISAFLLLRKDETRENKMENSKTNEPQFVKDGELNFIKKNNHGANKQIDIEVASTEETREQGLMWRKQMAESNGMLFIFEHEKPLSFWMKNTYIPLDIIYVNRQHEIVTIQYNATPFSEVSIPSNLPSQYVVEVNAGFCTKYNVEAGDRIDFTIINQNKK